MERHHAGKIFLEVCCAHCCYKYFVHCGNICGTGHVCVCAGLRRMGGCGSWGVRSLT